MFCNQGRIIAGAIEDGVSIVSRFTSAESIAVLPKVITSNALRGQSCRLPAPFNRSFAGRDTVFFQDARLPDRRTYGTVIGYPTVAPRITFTP